MGQERPCLAAKLSGPVSTSRDMCVTKIFQMAEIYYLCMPKSEISPLQASANVNFGAGVTSQAIHAN